MKNELFAGASSDKSRSSNAELRLAGTPERTLTSDLPLRRRPLYTAELLGHICFVHYRDILLRLFVVVKKNRHIFRREWNILSNSLFERSL